MSNDRYAGIYTAHRPEEVPYGREALRRNTVSALLERFAADPERWHLVRVVEGEFPADRESPRVRMAGGKTLTIAVEFGSVTTADYVQMDTPPDPAEMHWGRLTRTACQEIGHRLRHWWRRAIGATAGREADR